MHIIQKSPVLEAVNNVRLAFAANKNWEINYVDAKYANEQHSKYRAVVLKRIAQYREWDAKFRKQRDLRGLMEDSVDGEFMLAQIRLAFVTYRSVSRTSILVYREYLKQCQKS